MVVIGGGVLFVTVVCPTGRLVCLQLYCFRLVARLVVISMKPVTRFASSSFLKLHSAAHN